MNNNKETSRPSLFYVNWDSPNKEREKYKVELEALNSLIGSHSYEEDFRKILKETPLVVNLLPTLYELAKKGKADLARKNNLEVINSSNFCKDELLEYNFSLEKGVKLSDLDIEKYLAFTIKIGTKYLFTDLLKSSLVDYATGCEEIR